MFIDESIRHVENLTKIFRPFSGVIINAIDHTFHRKCRFETALNKVSDITVNKSNFLAVIQKKNFLALITEKLCHKINKETSKMFEA